MGCIYFVKHNGMDPIKIGYTNNSTPAARLSGMRVMAPYGLKLVTWFPHKKAAVVEKDLHARFASDRLRGEWYGISEAMAEQVSREYQPDYDDTVQQARMYVDEGLWEKSEEYIDDVELIKNNFWGQEMSKRDLTVKIADLVTNRDYKGAKQWIEKELSSQVWYSEYKNDKKGGRGRRGMKVFIGMRQPNVKPETMIWGPSE